MDEARPDPSIFRTKVNQLALALSETEFAVAYTLLAITQGEAEFGHRAQAEGALSKAEQTYTRLLTFMTEVLKYAPELAQEMRAELEKLRTHLDQVGRELTSKRACFDSSPLPANGGQSVGLK